MAKFSSSAFLDGGLSYLKSTATKMMLVKNYTFADSFATANGNKLAEATVASGDYTLSSNGNNRQVALPTGKSATASATSAPGDNLHIVFHDGSAVVYVTDETTDQVVTSGNTVNFPSLTYTSNQPT